jgi:ketosteroid isomerase-like protein
MKIRLLGAIAALASFALPTFAQLKEVTDPQVLQQLDALAKSYDTAFNKQDVAGIMATFTPDAVETGPWGPACGLDELRARYTKMFADWHPTDHHNTIEKVYMEGTAVYVLQRWAVDKWKGWVTLLEVPQGDQWLVKLVTFNFDPTTPPPTPSPSSAQEQRAVGSDPQIIAQLDTLGKKFSEAWNNNDAAALAGFYTEDAVRVDDNGPLYGRDNIQKWYSDLLKRMHISNHFNKRAQYYPIGTNEVWANGEWSGTVQGKSGGPPRHLKGYWTTILVRDGDSWKFLMETPVIASVPAATPSPTASPSNQ